MINIDWVIFFRILGFTALVPIGFGPTKIGLRLVLAALVAVIVGANSKVIQSNSPLFDLLIGLLLSAPLVLAPKIVNGAASLFDTLRGQSISSIFDPFSKSNSPAFGISMEKFTWVVLLASGALESGMRGVIESKFYLVVGGAAETANFGSLVIKLISQVTLGVWSSLLPFAVFCIGVELIGILCAKLLPKGSFTGDLFLIKSFVGISMLVVILEGGLPVVDGQIAMESFRIAILEK
jgi:type III secretory pathway component EscT